MSNQMKPSGYPAIGDIPVSWDVMRLHVVANLFGRIGWQGLTSDEYTDEGAYLITGTDFLDGGINWDTCVHVSERRWEEAWQIKVLNGDLLITKDGTVGKLAIVSGLDSHASLNSGLMRIVPNGQKGYSTKYLYYVLSSDVFSVWYENITSGASTIKHLFQGDFNHFVFPFPSINEQESIVEFLDSETAKVDEALSLLQQQVETLEAYKRSLIQETVTKGLDPSVPMKPSGVEWIGNIPEGWSIKRLKYVSSLKTGHTPDTGDSSYYDGDIDWYTPGDLNDEPVAGSERTITLKALKDNEASIVPKDSALLVGIGATAGKTGYLSAEASTNQQITAVIPKNSYFGKYLFYVLRSMKKTMNDLALFSTIPILNNQFVGTRSVPVPPITEQQAVANYLDSKCEALDKSLAAKREQIEVLKKQRQSLIYEYVTGKRRVS